MENQSNSFFDIFDSVVDKSIALTEKTVKNCGPIFTSTLSAFEKWLDSKLDKSSNS